MPDKELHIDTQVIHAAYAADPDTGSTTIPIHLSTAFAYKSAEDIAAVFAGKDAGFIYSRINNPTTNLFEQRMTALDDGLGAVACASGMAAITSTVLALAGQGDQIISGQSIFGGTHSLFNRTFSRVGIETSFVESTNAESYRDAITDRTKLIFVETLGNPKLDVPDIVAISAVAREHQIPLIVDNTATTPALLKPKTLGADVVIYSTSKYLNGHGNAIGGLILDCGTFDWSSPRTTYLHELHARVRHFAFLASLRTHICRDIGTCPSPFNVFLTAIGIDSLAVRMERHCDNSLKIARALSEDARVDEVRYPGLESHSDHAVAKRQFNDRYGALITLNVGTRERAFAVINGVEHIQRLANLGDAKSLIIHPASTFCREASEDERTAMGVNEGLIRLAVGIEHADDILDDLDRGLKKLN
jgi:O-acetylhomoserine (thiol)-lyase